MPSRSLALLGARLLVAQLFLLGSAQKWLDPDQVEGLLAGQGLPEWLIWPALAFNLVAGTLLALGVVTRPLALLLAAYCGITSLFHLIPSDGWQMSIFVKNWAIAGGCLALFGAGSGRFALRPD
jgi:putative oxidoreductase